MLNDKILEKKNGEKVWLHSPQVSIIIPAYNCAEFICETLDSVFVQTFKDYEVVLVNDGSPDTKELETVLENYLDKIIYLKQKNAGTAAARNTAIENSCGKFLAFLDSDDVWLPDYLKEQMNAINAKKCDLIYADALMFGNVRSKSETFMTLCPSSGTVTTESLISGKCIVITSGTIVRREKVLKAGLFDEDLPRIGMEDFDLWFRLAKSGAKFDYQKKVLLKYRVRPASLSGSNIQRAERSVKLFQLLEKKYVLTNAEKERLKSRSNLAIAELHIEKGKYNIIQENFAEARENLREANEYFQKFKFSVLIFLLGVSPKLVLNLFKKIRPTEVTFISPPVGQD